jgi:hypothetical protein
MLNPSFAIVGALISLFGCITYAWDTIRGKTQPNRVSWSLWATSPLVAFAAELAQGVKLQSLITFSAGFGPLIVLLASLVDRKAYWKIRPFDWYCAGLSLGSLALWWLTGKGNVAISFAICADLLACLPTATKAFTNPETESANAFIAGFVGVVITILTIQEWTFANYAFPIYLLVANGGIAGIIIIRAHVRAKAIAQSSRVRDS